MASHFPNHKHQLVQEEEAGRGRPPGRLLYQSENIFFLILSFMNLNLIKNKTIKETFHLTRRSITIIDLDRVNQNSNNTSNLSINALKLIDPTTLTPV